jgi:Uncharacterized protein conserved in bacteria
MSPRHHNDKKEIQDSTTDFFLKVIKKEKEKQTKENTIKESTFSKQSKTIDTVGRFYNYINQTVDKILSSKASVMILALIMASILFYSVVGKDILTSPTSGQTIDNVSVSIENLDPTLELSGVPDNVTVGLIGSSLDIYRINFSKDYEVYLDLSDKTEGEYTVQLNSRNFPDSLRVMIVPNTLKIKLMKKKTVEFDLGYRFINEDKLDSKYSVSVDEMEFSTVNVYASPETINKIAKVEACIDVSNQTQAFEQNAVIKAFDSNGNEMNVEISSHKVHVICNVASYSKTVNIQTHFTGDMPAGYQISKCTLSQNQVTIYGREELIKDIQEVIVDVDVSDMKSNVTLNNIALKKEAGINKFSTDSIDVNIEVDKVISKRIDKIPIKVLNNSEKYKVSFAGEGGYAEVLVTGTEAKINNLTADNIQASIDIDRLKVGTRSVNVKVASDDETLKVELLSSSKVTINIERN